MTPEIKTFLYKFIGIMLLSPLIGYVVLSTVNFLEKARKGKGAKKWVSLAVVGFLVAVLLGWLQ